MKTDFLLHLALMHRGDSLQLSSVDTVDRHHLWVNHSNKIILSLLNPISLQTMLVCTRIRALNQVLDFEDPRLISMRTEEVLLQVEMGAELISIHITNTAPEIALHRTEDLLKNTEVFHHKKVVQPVLSLSQEQTGIALIVTQMNPGQSATVAHCYPPHQMTPELHPVVWESKVLKYIEMTTGVDSLLR